ncbi:MAG: hypothetical protein DCC88_12260 [Spirobacillus cienkowskii]|jgi:hypothetical protein|uniref:Class I SAM-dependent DNA methyltransferase n=1 Tax=Spirobacillus cienkowskii TaxID=495820 RepID=A0A369KV85_9BACT|nr:MAG: hypothetical protein DCC88_12260 [Spirobacillus cienkowskii]
MIAKKSLNVSNLENRKKNTRPDGSSLYFKNVGLFSDPYLNELPNFQDEKWATTLEVENSFIKLKKIWDEWNSHFENYSEAQLETEWIQPVLKEIGFSFHVQDRLKKYGRNEIPDYSLFENDIIKKKALNCKDDDSYFKHTIGISDAKAMNITLDGSKLNKTNPSYQILWYLTITKKNWGILSNGRYWRIYSPMAKSRYNSYFEINIEKCFNESNIEAYKYFYYFFRKEAFCENPMTGKCFLDSVFEGGEKYARQVEKNLKTRAFEIVEQICQGFYKKHEKQKELSSSYLNEIYKNSLYFLFRLMFILNCESKNLLNVHKQEAYYKYSLRKICNDIKTEKNSNTKWGMLGNTYSQILNLFKLLAEGDESIGIHGFGYDACNSNCNEFLKNNSLPDRYMNQALIDLAYAKDEHDELSLIDYKCLSADHLGSIFEGLLEYNLGYEKDNTLPVLLNSDGIRKKSGSY